MTLQTHRMNFPLSEADARTLKAGDQVIIDGEIVVTAGLPTHHRLIGCFDGKEPLPMALQGQSLFHLGSYSREKQGGRGADDLELLYINPTTSTRFNPVMPRIIHELQLHAIGGKGGLDGKSVEAMQKTGCVYLSFLGGGATLHTRAVREVLEVGWSDMLMHYRLVRLRVEGMGPVTVAIDAHGQSTYADAQTQAAARMDSIMAALDEGRARFAAATPPTTS
ncbi:MAG: fumarate hydratase C-terminal domain-containing protein [Polaromonas sp.]|uniref:fumarate hydratase C-terminal domain-containing protein n=1 Tax=Polaromonas sp. TaxID=1869339 RepID=UPI0025E6F2E6|nr:fumarate hydratase C-terminal domain-containing protein [Polaromonas sp.]MBI2726884.1 fumarate hydratase C-terminal domain-containing protein [Polaromonas sp.]